LDPKKLRGQGYDGGSNMSGCLKGVQARLRGLESRAVFIHCGNHCLNLGSKHVAENIMEVRNVLSSCQSLGDYVRGSPKREAKLKEIAGEDYHKIIKIAPTRWTVRGPCLRSVIRMRVHLLEFFRHFSEVDNCAQARGFHDQLMSPSFRTILHSAHEVLAVTEQLATVLQDSKMTFLGVKKALEVFVRGLRRISFEDIKKTVAALPDLTEAHNTRKATNFEKVHNDYVESTIEEVMDRFQQEQLAPLIAIEKLLMSAWGKLDEEALATVVKFYGDDVKEDRLRSDIMYLGDTIPEAEKPKDASEVVEKFKELPPTSQRVLPQFQQLLHLLLVVPMTSSHAERSFSTMKREKTPLRSRMGQKRLNAQAMMMTHKTILEKISDDEVADAFAAQNDDRRKRLGSFL